MPDGQLAAKAPRDDPTRLVLRVQHTNNMADLVALRVSGLRENTTEADIRAAFATYGFINDVKIEEGGRAIVTVHHAARTGCSEGGGRRVPEGRATSMRGVGGRPEREAILVHSTAGLHPVGRHAAAGAATSACRPPHQQYVAAPTVPPPPPPPAVGQPYGAYGGAYWPQQPQPQQQPQHPYWDWAAQQQQQPPPPPGPPPAYYGGMPAPAPPPPPPGPPPAPAPPPPDIGPKMRGDECKLFVGGLPIECTEYEVRQFMMPYGPIGEIHVMKPSTQTHQRCAFVTYEHHASALAATKMHGTKKMKPEDKPIVVRFADDQHAAAAGGEEAEDVIVREIFCARHATTRKTIGAAERLLTHCGRRVVAGNTRLWALPALRALQGRETGAPPVVTRTPNLGIVPLFCSLPPELGAHERRPARRRGPTEPQEGPDQLL